MYKFQCEPCNESYYGECVRHLNVRIGRVVYSKGVLEHFAPPETYFDLWVLIYFELSYV